MRLVVWSAAFLLAACGSIERGSSDDGQDGADGADDGVADDGTDDDGDGSSPDGSPGGDGGGGGYTPLITAEWTLPAGQEGYTCATVTLEEDVYAGALRPMAPLGTHHTVIDLRAPSGPDDPSFPCGPEFGEFWASGIGSGELVLPDGVGLLAPAGMQLRLSLHLFNASDEPLSGISGLEVKRLDPAEVEHTATVSYHGPLGFEIPNDNEPHEESHEVTLGASTAVAIFPHMHALGTYFTAFLRREGVEEPILLWDEEFQFESQEVAALDEIEIQAGDVLETTCTWLNTTKSPVGWGHSSEAEMCFSILMTY